MVIQGRGSGRKTFHWAVCAICLGFSTLLVNAQPAASQPSSNLPLAGAVSVKALQFEGNTRFSSERLNREVAEILHRNNGNLTLDDLEEIRQRLTLLYINAGYINSGAILPDQTI